MINAKRLSYILSATLSFIVIACFGLTFYTNSWLTKKAEGLVSIKLETIGLEEKQRANEKAAKDLKYYESTRILLEKIVPKSKDQAKAIGEILNIAAEVGVSINTMTFPASELGAAAAKTVAGSTPAAAAANTNAVTQAKAVPNIPGLLGIEVSLSQIDKKNSASGTGVTYSQLIALLEAIEKNRRTMQIKTLQVLPLKTPSGAISGYSLTLTMNIFVKP